jgi:hypothetical protein
MHDEGVRGTVRMAREIAPRKRAAGHLQEVFRSQFFLQQKAVAVKSSCSK